MEFNLIDKENWKRKEYYNHYMDNLRCTYSLTANIDITKLRIALKSVNKKIYPALIYMITTTVNELPEFRMSTNADGELGCWDEMVPSYTIFNKETETFSSIWTMFDSSFIKFYKECSDDIESYSKASNLTPKSNEPLNTFNISCLPWVNFTSFNLNVYTDRTYTLPIFTIGGFDEQNDRTLIPLAVQVHHSVCDGFHVSKFINSLQKVADSFDEWLYT